MKRPVPLLATLCLASLLAVAGSAAPTVRVVPDGGGARLLIGKKLITFFRTPNGSLSPQDRADRAAERLRELLGAGLSPKEIDARPRGAAWGVYARGGLLMIATPDEAAERKEDPETVARRWAANLKEVLAEAGDKGRGDKGRGDKPRAEGSEAKGSRAREKNARRPETREPALALAATELLVPVGERRVVAVNGSSTGPIQVRVDGEAATAAPVPGKAQVEVRGEAPGKVVIHVSREGKEATLTAQVRKYAGRLAASTEAAVTGNASAALVRRTAEEQALATVEKEPGAVVRIAGPAEGSKPLSRDQSTEVRVPIEITGGSSGYLPVHSAARVRVRNVSLPPQDARWLLYSNDPETVREYGTLYQAAVENSGPVRLFFHHQNRMGRAFLLQVHLLNPNDAPVDVQIVEGGAGPLLDTIQVGHRAGERYMAAALTDTGYIAQIPAHGTRTIYTAQLPDKLTVSGIYGLRIVNGGPLVTEVTASAGPVRPEIAPDLLTTARSEPHMYPSPLKEKSYAYHVGDRWTFIPLGREAITGTSPNRKLFGNYGVVYDLTVDVENPTEADKTVKLVFSAEAGWVRGVFVIDGKLIEAPELAPPGESVLWSVKLAPKEQKRVRIRTIPVGGSFYPASIVVRS